MRSLQKIVCANRQRLPLVLWCLLFLFVLRVLGQFLVVLGRGGPLPPMGAWQSGLLPYPYLFMSQILIIILYGKICLDFTRREGFFFDVPRKKSGRGLLVFGALYFISMLARYSLTMWLFPERRWIGGAIPVFFHLVLATFILLVGQAYDERPRAAAEEALTA